MDKNKTHFDVMSLFNGNKSDFVKISAPMVRYSKLQFRSLLRSYNCDLCFTPMILADSFCQSSKARNNEFTTNSYDSPIITQFAANNVNDFVTASKLISPFCDGVDLNCGCPQRWAKHMGIGCVMLENPQIIFDMVQECRNQIARPFTVSVKMRILKDVKKTLEVCKQLENCGISFLTIHSRTSSQLTGDIDLNTLKLITESVNVPIIANGGVKSLEDCQKLHQEVNCQGVMVANGLLTNPMLFTGSKEITIDCIQKWINICFNSTIKPDDYNSTNKLTIKEKPYNLTFQCFHHHLVFMLEKFLPRAKRRIFNDFKRFDQVLDFLADEFKVFPQLFDLEQFEQNQISNLVYNCEINNKENVVCEYDYEKDGNFFKNKVQFDGNEEFGIQELYLEG
nr:tRNA-dihydrouridine(20a/20b) synthase [NAD(P)+]-like [Onthophagus taurus]